MAQMAVEKTRHKWGTDTLRLKLRRVIHCSNGRMDINEYNGMAERHKLINWQRDINGNDGG